MVLIRSNRLYIVENIWPLCMLKKTLDLQSSIAFQQPVYSVVQLPTHMQFFNISYRSLGLPPPIPSCECLTLCKASHSGGRLCRKQFASSQAKVTQFLCHSPMSLLFNNFTNLFIAINMDGPTTFIPTIFVKLCL